MGYRRVEVLTGPGRRRRWSDQDKAQAVAESLVSGASPSQIARQWQICPQQLFTWRRQARAGLLALPAASDLAATMAPEPALVPIFADRPLPSPPSAPAVTATPPAPVEIEIAGAIVRAPVGLDGTVLTAVLRAVRASATRR